MPTPKRPAWAWHPIYQLLLVAALIYAAAFPARAADPLDSDPEYFAAAGSFANGQYDRAIVRLAELLKRYPRHARVQMLLADAYERAGDPAAARRLYEAVLAPSASSGQAGKPEPRIEAAASEGLARLARGPEREPAEPAKSAAAAPGQKLFDLTPEQITAMSVVYRDMTRRQTDHFDISTNNPTLADLLAQRVESIFDRVRRPILGDQLYAHRIELIVYPDQAAFLKAHPAPHWSGGGFLFAPQPDGAIRRAVMLYQVDEENRFRSTLLSRELPHELTHVVVREFFGQTTCPLWLDEGLATTAEADGGKALADRMGELLAKGSAVPLADMLDQAHPALDRPVSFYVQSASWTRFLRSSLSDAQMKGFLGQVKDGQKPSVALGRVLFLDDRAGWLAAMEERWHKWAGLTPPS